MLEACDIDIEVEHPHCDVNKKNCNTQDYNKMIYPLRRTTLKGFLWYQGEANTDWNRDKYNCSFPVKIDAWRKLFSSNSNTKLDAPYGFVQLSTNRPKADLGTAHIRWHQTSDYGFVPNTRQENVFMAVAIDTYDEQNGIHPRYKQVVGERLSVSGMNVVYNDKSYPANGPLVAQMEVTSGPVLQLKYDQDISYTNEEISGFFYCCTFDFEECDSGSNRNWKELSQELVEFDGFNVITIKIGELVVCEMEVPHIAYLWRQTPVVNYLGAPIYSKDLYSLPSAPWKISASNIV